MRALSRRAGLRVFRFFVRDVQKGKAEVAPAGIQLRLLWERDAVALCEDRELDLREDAVRNAYGRGDVCVGAFHDGAIAGYCWLAFAPVHHLDGVWVEFDRSMVWTYKSLVRPAYRGRKIAAALYRFGDAAAVQRGRSASVICVESHNRPSVGAALSAGYRGAGYAGYIVRPTGVRYWLSPAAKGHGIGFTMPAAK